GVPGHEHAVYFRGQFDQVASLARRRRQRLLHEHVFSGVERRLDDVMVGGDGRRDGNGFYVRVAEERVERLVAKSRGVALPDPLEPLGRDIAEGEQLCLRPLLQVAGEIRPPVTEAHDGSAYRGHPVSVRAHAVPSPRSNCSGVRKSKRRSSPSDQLRTYATSMSSASPNVACARAVTCHRPVIPCGTRKRSKWCG